ncbi:hypothetical protein KC660_03175 [Candidatus Dojkabacteria bacterium]|uniref:Uncharacterized protein n=1 Tax=Candidatus Dojkabacteria bacterium TaxID=2099670 RepID=A0A955L487_9BACT|nr:hypothetical protein [Candidatus Dojkabacteria bacterium]
MINVILGVSKNIITIAFLVVIGFSSTLQLKSILISNNFVVNGGYFALASEDPGDNGGNAPSNYVGNCGSVTECIFPNKLQDSVLVKWLFNVNDTSELPGSNLSPTLSGLGSIFFTLISCLFVIGVLYFFFVMVKTIIFGMNFLKGDNSEDYELARKKFIELGKAFLIPLLSILAILFFSYTFGFSSPFLPSFHYASLPKSTAKAYALCLKEPEGGGDMRTCLINKTADVCDTKDRYCPEQLRIDIAKTQCYFIYDKFNKDKEIYDSCIQSVQ